MRFILFLLLLVFAAIGVAAMIDHFGLYDVPMVDVVKQAESDA